MPVGLAAEVSHPGGPRTPPDTPARVVKRKASRNDSPASTTDSIHPVETTSPSKHDPTTARVPTSSSRPPSPSHITVQELTEDDPGYATDLDVQYPEEIEEIASTAGDSASDADSDSDSRSTATDFSTATGTTRLTRRLSRLNCAADTPRPPRPRHRFDKRTDSRLFKRPHHETVMPPGAGGEDGSGGGGMGDADSDAIDDHDFEGSQRRLRRRTKGPMDEIVFADLPRSSPEATGSPSRAAAAGRKAAYVNIVYPHPFDSDEMEVDGAGR